MNIAANSYYPSSVLNWSGTIDSSAYNYASVNTVGATATVSAATATIGSPYIFKVP